MTTRRCIKHAIVALVVAQGGTMFACSASNSGSKSTPHQGAPADPATVWKKLQGLEMTAVSSGIYDAEASSTGEELDDFYITPSASVCEEEWIDFGCDETFPHSPSEDDCADPLVMDFEEETACPVCVEPPEVARSCAEAQRHYLEFLDHNLREACTNWCETDSDCSAAEIDACGLTFAVALRALVDEEPMAYAKSFAADNCQPCASTSDDAEPSNSARLLEFAKPVCRQRQCVLVGEADTAESAP